MIAALAAIRAIFPWQAWAAAGVFVAATLWHWHAVNAAYRDGKAAARAEITKANEKAKKDADDAEKAARACFGVWDRAHGVCLSHSPR